MFYNQFIFLQRKPLATPYIAEAQLQPSEIDVFIIFINVKIYI